MFAARPNEKEIINQSNLSIKKEIKTIFQKEFVGSSSIKFTKN